MAFNATGTENDLFGLLNVSRFCGPGATLGYFFILLGFYVDLFAWVRRGGHHSTENPLKSWLSNRKGWKLLVSKDDDYQERYLFGLNMKFLVVVAYYGYFLYNIIWISYRAQEKSGFASLVNAIIYHETTVSTAGCMAYVAICALFLTRYFNTSQNALPCAKSTINLEFSTALLFALTVVASNAWVYWTNLPGGDSILPYLKDNQAYYSLIAPSKDLKDVAGNIEKQKSVLEVVASACSWSLPGVFSVLMAILGPLISGIGFCVSIACLFNIWLGCNSLLSDQGRERSELRIAIGFMILNVSFLTLFVGGGFFFISMLDLTTATLLIVTHGFRALPGAPGSFTDIDQILPMVGGLVGFALSCYNALFP